MTGDVFTPSLEGLPNNFPLRRVSLAGWGDLNVPRHIVRIDCCPSERVTETHGWQTRYRGNTRFFSDSTVQDRERTPKMALQMAVNHLAKVYEGQATQVRERERKDKLFFTGRAGIRVLWLLNARNFEEVYIEVSRMAHNRSAKKFYVGTCNTANDARLAEKMVEACAYRDKIVAEHEALMREKTMVRGEFFSKTGRRCS